LPSILKALGSIASIEKKSFGVKILCSTFPGPVSPHVKWSHGS
jgi:hypothetical protein